MWNIDAESDIYSTLIYEALVVCQVCSGRVQIPYLLECTPIMLTTSMLGVPKGVMQGNQMNLPVWNVPLTCYWEQSWPTDLTQLLFSGSITLMDPRPYFPLTVSSQCKNIAGILKVSLVARPATFLVEDFGSWTFTRCIFLQLCCSLTLFVHSPSFFPFLHGCQTSSLPVRSLHVLCLPSFFFFLLAFLLRNVLNV